MNKKKVLITLRDFLTVLVGNCSDALGVVLFLNASSLITGGTTGIAIFVRHLTGIPLPLFVFLLNMVMFLVGFIALGKRYALSTAVSTVFYPSALALFEWIFRDVVLTTNPLLCTVFSGLLIGVGVGLVMRAGASSGGMDVPSLILHRFTRIPLWIPIYVTDIIILFLQATFSDTETILYGILLILIYSFVIDRIQTFGTAKMQLQVISSSPAAMRETLLRELNRGVTLFHGQTGFLRQETDVILTVVSIRELNHAQKLILDTDPEAFVIITRVSEVQGRGFTLGKIFRSSNEAINAKTAVPVPPASNDARP